jgi:enoyl-CoA hydratase/carnithine racemase
MLLTSARVKGKEAFEIGLADFLVPQSELMPKAEELANEINAAGPFRSSSDKRDNQRRLG